MPHVARKFERLLETYRRGDGGTWSGIELERATGGVITRSYVTNLRKGRIENPGMDKLAALVRAMDFPPRTLVRGRAVRRRGRGAAGRPEGLAQFSELKLQYFPGRPARYDQSTPRQSW